MWLQWTYQILKCNSLFKKSRTQVNCIWLCEVFKTSNSCFVLVIAVEITCIYLLHLAPIKPVSYFMFRKPYAMFVENVAKFWCSIRTCRQDARVSVRLVITAQHYAASRHVPYVQGQTSSGAWGCRTGNTLNMLLKNLPLFCILFFYTALLGREFFF